MSNAATVTVSVELPSDAYLALEQFARALGITVGHAAALTIFAGQQTQNDQQSRLDDKFLNERKD